MTWFEILVRKASLNGIAFDTNIMLLYVIGSINPALISQVKLTSTFTADDYSLLLGIVSKAHAVYLTPHVITESCNLLDSENRKRNYSVFGTLIDILQISKESFRDSSSLMKYKAFIKFGLADTSLIDLASKGCVIITDDLPLKGFLESSGLPVLNFNNIRFQ